MHLYAQAFIFNKGNYPTLQIAIIPEFAPDLFMYTYIYVANFARHVFVDMFPPTMKIVGIQRLKQHLRAMAATTSELLISQILTNLWIAHRLNLGQ